jgi:uncharacterized zinc-type alcohol dehydrogenase-like protein
MGADYVVDSRSDDAITALAGKFDMILSTVNVDLNWPLYINALAPKGRLHLVGATLNPIPIVSFQVIMGQKGVTGTATGSPAVVAKMLEFCDRHGIETITEKYPMSRINEAIERLESGKARYRIVLENDF